MYCDDMELSKGQVAIWCKIRSVLNPKSAPYNYPTLVSSDEGGIMTSQWLRQRNWRRSHPSWKGLYQRNREQRFWRGGKDRRRRRIRPAHCQSKTKLSEGHTLWPRYPFRQNQVRRSDWLVARITSPTKSYAISFLRLTYSPGFAQHLRLPRLSP